MIKIDRSKNVPVPLEKFKMFSKIYANNKLYIIRMVSDKKLGVLTVEGINGRTYSVLDKMKTLEKYLRDLGSNMDFKKVEHQLVEVTFGD